MATVLVTGASGYIGGRLVPELLASGHRVRVLARTPGKLDQLGWRQDVEVIAGDAADPGPVADAMAGCDAAYFLIHSMGAVGDFAEQDRTHASVFRDAAASAGVGRIVYLGGLGADDDDLSPHLASRHEVGRVLADGDVPVLELRAAVIIGSGSASFEMLRNLTEVLPVMVTPTWVQTRCQPIAIRDVLTYLVRALDIPLDESRILEVAGPDVVTYEEMMHAYGDAVGLRRRRLVRVPVLSPSLSSHWVGLVTPLPGALARPLVESLVNEVVVADRSIADVVDHEPLPFRHALELAIRRVEDLDVRTRWADAALPGTNPADPLPTDPDWAGGRLLVDEKEAETIVSAEVVYGVVTGLGGTRGWLVADLLWDLRGWVDTVLGGVGRRRGRRDPDRLRVGDALDFWRVEAVDPPRLLRLRAEMRMPGDAWLEWVLDPTPTGTRIAQRAVFHPRGVLGRLYWYSMFPFHALIFGQLVARIAARADAVARATPTDP